MINPKFLFTIGNAILKMISVNELRENKKVFFAGIVMILIFPISSLICDYCIFIGFILTIVGFIVVSLYNFILALGIVFLVMGINRIITVSSTSFCSLINPICNHYVHHYTIIGLIFIIIGGLLLWIAFKIDRSH